MRLGFQVTVTDTPEVLGEYVCEAANPMGTVREYMDLRLLKEPQTPNIGINPQDVRNSSVVVEATPIPPSEFTYKIHYTEYTYCSSEEKWKRAKIYHCPPKKSKRQITRIHNSFQNIYFFCFFFLCVQSQNMKS